MNIFKMSLPVLVFSMAAMAASAATVAVPDEMDMGARSSMPGMQMSDMHMDGKPSATAPMKDVKAATEKNYVTLKAAPEKNTSSPFSTETPWWKDR